MKTDRFSDIIRRKLESIRPEFTEKDWARMQATLHQASPPQPGSAGTGQPFGGSIWSSHPWMMAAAGVGTAALVTFSVWQRNEINSLRETVGQLKQKSDSAQVAPLSPESERPTLSQADFSTQSSSSQSSQSLSGSNQQVLAGKRDTVYITRYVTEPSRLRLEGTDERSVRGLEASDERRYATTSRAPASTGSLRQRNDLNSNQKTDSYGVSSTPLTSDKTTSDLGSPTLTGTRNAPLRGQQNTSYPSTSNENLTNPFSQNETERSIATGRNSRRNKRFESNSPGNQYNNNETIDKAASSVAKRSLPTESQQTEQVATTSGTSASYELAASRALSTKTVNWNALVAQRSKRIRQAWTPAVVDVVEQKSSAPESQPVPRLGTKFRLGIGGELAGNSNNAGVFAEVLLGKNWSLGVGFVKATYTNKFADERDFEYRTNRELKNAFGPEIDQFRDIVGIDTRQTRYQIPLNLGYRIPLNESLTLLTSAGTSLNLNNSENVTFACRLPFLPWQQPQSKFGQVDFNKQQPVSLISSLALSTGVEWHSRHWALQGSPVLNIPIQATATTMQPDQNWQQKTTVSLRARLLYQF